MIRWSLLIGLLAAGFAARPADGEQPKNNGKNVILFVVDDQGFQAGCYGDHVIHTPGIDRLAASGTRFTRAGCTSASCSASRSVILTGLINHATGHYGHSHSYHHFSTYDSVPTLPVLLSKAGYRTCSIGKYHVAPEYVYHFDEYRNQGIIGGARNSVMMADNAIAWMKEDDERPFFLYFCTTDPHRGPGPGNFANFSNKEEPYPGCERITYNPDDITPPPWLPDQPEVRAELAEYYQAISRLDQGLVKLLDYLDESGHDRDTLVIFLSDNGPPFPGAKTNLHEPGRNLPLIVRSPDQQKRGVVCDAMVDWADVTPTILDFCAVTPEPAPPIQPLENVGPPEYRPAPRRNQPLEPVTFHGDSFLGVLEEEHPDGWDETYASHTFHEITMYYPMRVVIEGKWKLIFNIAHQLPYPFASDLYASPTWQGVLKRGDKYYGQRTVESYIYRPRFELYDLEADPWETNNLATDSAHQDILEHLQKKLQQWQLDTNDPWELKWRYE